MALHQSARRRPPIHTRTLRTGAVWAISVGMLAGCSSSPTGGGTVSAEPSESSAAAAPSSTASTTPSTSPSPSPSPSPTAEPTPEQQELPRGGVELFPDYRLVGFSGHPFSPGLGRLGIGAIDERAAEIEALGTELAGGRKVLPVLELIAVVVQADPGADGAYRTRTSDEIIGEYLDAARRHDGLLLLNVQPGRASMADEVRALEKWLAEPDVGVAIDPEWDITAEQLPGQAYGHTSGEEINEIAAYVDTLVKEKNLPQKPLVFHQVAPGVVSNVGAIQEYEGVEVIRSVDGIGSASMKIETYNLLMEDLPPTVHAGFKLFFEEDVVLGPLMTPPEVLALTPQPEYVLYE
ncbi:hypothetical protein [Arthrobacter sp. D2-10]